MDKSWIVLPRWEENYKRGLKSFVDYVKAYSNVNDIHYCPCRKCKCRSDMCCYTIDIIWQHLKKNGFWKQYTCWIYHGEPSPGDEHDHGQFSQGASTSNDPTTRLINDMFPFESGVFDQPPAVTPVVGGFSHIEPIHSLPTAVNTAGIDKYNNLIALQQAPLYPGCNKTVLESVLEIMKLKVDNKLSANSVDEWLDYISKRFPVGHRHPTTHNKVRHILKHLGLSYIKIHACLYDCVLFWGKDADGKDLSKLDACPVCFTERYKLTPAGNKKAVKILRYFPLVDRLERLFMCAKTAEAMRWWAERTMRDDDTLIHPSDGAAWKYMVNVFANFASEVRNVWLGLSADGFNPFGKQSLKYSIWPVILVPYNLPPWMCMKKEYNMLTLLIPGPGYPGKCIDVYLRPLIEELKHLSSRGHPTYDRFKNEMFQMRAMLVGTISDFPARGMLSGTPTKGYRACPECLTEELSSFHCSKIVQMRHRCWLPHDHPFREDWEAFDGTVETGDRPRRWTGDEILEVLNEYDFGPLSNHPAIVASIPVKPDRYKFWTHKSIFWELSYWPKLPIRHYLDVMHIEKNVCESLVGTVLAWEGKTKDGLKAREDLKKMGLRSDLWLIEGKKKMPQAPYTVARVEKNEIFRWMGDVRYPSGFAGNIGRCVNFNDNKIYGLKSHDCHILLQRLFPVFIRGYLPKEVEEPLVALSRFFQKACTREIRKSDLKEMQQDIIFILCKLERIFPPNFFDIMPHLMIHLPEQLLLTGPVHFTWMYPMERQLGAYKGFVQNNSAPEGCIAEAYLSHECVTYTKLYLGALEDTPQHMSVDEPHFNLSILSHDVVVDGNLPPEYELEQYEMVIAHWSVLINCPEVQFWKNCHLTCPEVGGDLEYHNSEFANYFGDWMNHVQFDGHPQWSHELRLLAMKPIKSRVYPICSVNGVQFVCEERDVRRRTQNSGVMVPGQQNGIDYYGVLHSVVELTYGEGMKVHLFKCRWFNTSPRNTRIDDHGTFSVNTARTWYQDEPFVFATAVRQVFYLDDLRHKGAWKVVNHVVQRNIYSAATLGENVDNEEDTAYQEPNVFGIPESSTIRLNNVIPGRVVQRESVELVDVNPNEDEEDSGDEERYILPEIDDEEDSSDSDYEP